MKQYFCNNGNQGVPICTKVRSSRLGNSKRSIKAIFHIGNDVEITIEDLVEEQIDLLSDAEKSLAEFQSKEQMYDQNAQSSLLTSRIIELENNILESHL